MTDHLDIAKQHAGPGITDHRRAWTHTGIAQVEALQRIAVRLDQMVARDALRDTPEGIRARGIDYDQIAESVGVADDETARFELSLTEYQAATRDTAIYPRASAASTQTYCTLGLTGEAGEVANEVKKIYRDDGWTLTGERKAKLRDELGDVLWYAARLADELGLDLGEIAERNLERLAARKTAGTLRGGGDR